MKAILSLFLLLILAGQARPDEHDEARAAIAKAQASQPAPWLNYSDGYWKAKRENKPLVVFVGAPVMMDVPGAVCCEGSHEEWGPHNSVFICNQGATTVHSEMRADVGPGPIRAAVRALLAPRTVAVSRTVVVAQPMTVQPMMMQMQAVPMMRMQSHSTTMRMGSGYSGGTQMRAAPMRMSVRSGGACAG